MISHESPLLRPYQKFCWNYLFQEEKFLVSNAIFEQRIKQIQGTGPSRHWKLQTPDCVPVSFWQQLLSPVAWHLWDGCRLLRLGSLGSFAFLGMAQDLGLRLNKPRWSFLRFTADFQKIKQTSSCILILWVCARITQENLHFIEMVRVETPFPVDCVARLQVRPHLKSADTC